MRILIHTQFYPPEMGAPQARLSDLAGRLVKMGHKVKVITAMPNYPTGKVFEGYPRFYMMESRDGMDVYRSWIFPSNKKSLIHRLVSYLSFSLSSLITGIVMAGRLDIVITESPPLFLAAAGWIMAKMKGARWIMNVSDLWPDSAKYIGMINERGIAYKAMRALAHFLYRKAWIVTGQSREIIAEIQAQAPSAQVYHLSNGVDTMSFTPSSGTNEFRKRYLKDGETGFIFAGLHGLFQGLDQIISAADRLRGEPLRFVLIGDGTEKESLIRRTEELGLTNIDFYTPLPHEQMPSVLASMDVALITLKSSIRGAVPSKIYEAMACGVSVLLVADGEAKDIILNSGAGLAVKPGDIDNLVDSVQQLARNPALRLEKGRSGRVAAVERYDRQKIAEQFNIRLNRGFN